MSRGFESHALRSRRVQPIAGLEFAHYGSIGAKAQAGDAGDIRRRTLSFGVLVGALGGLAAAFRASRIEPSEALRL
jgi:hypothetical protein